MRTYLAIQWPGASVMSRVLWGYPQLKSVSASLSAGSEPPAAGRTGTAFRSYIERKMLYVETTTKKALAKRLVCCPKLRMSQEPKVVVGVVYLLPDGERLEVDAVLPARSYYRLMRRGK